MNPPRPNMDPGIHHEWLSLPGGHEWKVWPHSLAALLPLLFQPER